MVQKLTFSLVRGEFFLVGVAGFEPTAPRSQSECATKLRHTPMHHAVHSAAYAPNGPAWTAATERARYPIGQAGTLKLLRQAGRAGVAQW